MGVQMDVGFGVTERVSWYPSVGNVRADRRVCRQRARGRPHRQPAATAGNETQHCLKPSRHEANWRARRHGHQYAGHAGFGPPDVELKDAEVKVAHQLIEALAADWDPEKYKDTFQENLKQLIETKLEGGEVAAVEKPKKLAPVIDLMAALKQSLAQMEGKKKPAATIKSEEPAAANAKSRRR